MYWQGCPSTDATEKMLREGPLCGTGMQSVDKVALAIHPATKMTGQSRKQIVYLLFLALTEIQTAVTEPQV